MAPDNGRYHCQPPKNTAKTERRRALGTNPARKRNGLRKVLITGASGYVGKAALAALIRRRVPVVALGREPLALPDGSDFIRSDLLSEPDLERVVAQAGATHLMHLAWYAEHGKYWASPLNLAWVTATMRLIEAFAKAGGKAVAVAGSVAEYDWSYGYCREAATPCAPATLYGTAKDAARRLAAAFCKDAAIPLGWARLFWNYGPGEAPTRLVPSLIAALRGQKPPFAVDAGAYRDFLHIDDAGEGLVRLLEVEFDGPVNIASGEPLRISDLVRTLASALNADPSPILNLAAERQGEPRLVVGENARLRALGWRPRHSLADGLVSAFGAQS